MPIHKDLEIAYQFAPIFCQKVHEKNPRGDFISRIDFRKQGKLEDVKDNFKYVNAPYENEEDLREAIENNGPFDYELKPYVYYSVVESPTHYFIIYAFYHPQDWYDGFIPLRKHFDEHPNDMEGCLVVVSKARPEKERRVEAVITVWHDDYCSFASWVDNEGKALYPDDIFTITDVKSQENIDGNLHPMWHKDEKGEDFIRFRLYSASGGHAVRADKDFWGHTARIIRYYPSLEEAQQPPTLAPGTTPSPLYDVKVDKPGNRMCGQNKTDFEAVPYELVDIFAQEKEGLWQARNDLKVFRNNEKGQAAFVELKKKKLGPGAAKPPWGWMDRNDNHRIGELALQPALIVYDYFSGLREFSLQYERNTYLGIG